MAKLVTVSNEFHGTATRVRAGYLSKPTVARVRRTLCGASGCSCGGALGQRGSQFQPSGTASAVIEPQSDGTVWVSWANR